METEAKERFEPKVRPVGYHGHSGRPAAEFRNDDISDAAPMPQFRNDSPNDASPMPRLANDYVSDAAPMPES